jgi:serine O-acetyltransferase
MLVTDGALCTVLYRMMRFLQRGHLGPPAALVYKLNALLTGAVIGRGAEFGPGLVILHSQALVVNASVRGGENVVLEGCVTVGAEKDKAPVLGDRVFVGSGARVLGPVAVGSGARIGANAVVLTDVPENATAVGVPAKVVKVREGPA